MTLDLDQIIKIFVAITIILNPVGNIAFFSTFTAGQSKGEKHRTAHITALTVFITLVLMVWLGSYFLSFFGISLGSLQLGSGLAILLIGVEMLRSGPADPHTETMNLQRNRNVAVVPLAIPIIAGPAMVSLVIAEAQRIETIPNLFILTGIGAVGTTIVWVFLLFAVPITQWLGATGINIISRLIGLIYLAIAAESFAKGLKNLFPQLCVV